MKAESLISLSALLAGAAATCLAAAPQEKKLVFRDAATHENLSLKLRKAEANDPMKKLEAVEGEDPSKVNRPTDLLEQSDIICFRGFATLVPKRAILATPENYKRYLKLEPGARIVPWSDFYARNRGWITTVEVNRVQAEGGESMGDETNERIAKSSNLVVATLKGGPISVLPLRTPEKEDGEDQKTTQR